MESFGGFLVLRTGEGWPGIQQASEWPSSLHSFVQFPVIATSGMERISVGEIETNCSIRKVYIDLNIREKRGIFEQKLCHLKHPPPPTPPPMSLQLLLSSRQQLLCSSCYAVCNENNHVCRPQTDVLHSGDGMRHLCHLEVSKRSSGTFEMDLCIVEAPY